MLDHKKEAPTDDRYERLSMAHLYPQNDGLNSLEYSVVSTSSSKNFLHLVVDI